MYDADYNKSRLFIASTYPHYISNTSTLWIRKLSMKKLMQQITMLYKSYLFLILATLSVWFLFGSWYFLKSSSAKGLVYAPLPRDLRKDSEWQLRIERNRKRNYTLLERKLKIEKYLVDTEIKKPPNLKMVDQIELLKKANKDLIELKLAQERLQKTNLNEIKLKSEDNNFLLRSESVKVNSELVKREKALEAIINKTVQDGVEIDECGKHKAKTEVTPLYKTVPGPETQKTIRVLYAYYPVWYEMPDEIAYQCPNNVRCIRMTNVSYYQEADVINYFVLFDGAKSVDILPGQKVMIYLAESPDNAPISEITNYEKLKDKVNWVMAYRMDADIYHPYGKFMKKEMSADEYNKFEQSMRVLFRQKTRSVAWLVSNCITKSRREKYVDELIKYVDVDIIGSCGHLKCDKSNYRNKRCLDLVTAKYKYYLAFENSLCDDYVTEKFFNTFLQKGIVPIVRGRANYSAFAPANSFIDTKDFKSPLELAKHIMALGENEDEYVKMFSWVKHYEPVLNFEDICQVCQKYLDESTLPYTCHYKDLGHWWNYGRCQKPTDLLTPPSTQPK